MSIISFGRMRIMPKLFIVELGHAPTLHDQKINYIHENPVRAGIVENAEDYLYSSARAFAGFPCSLEIPITILPIERIPLMRTVR